jgi:hypothetical protein
MVFPKKGQVWTYRERSRFLAITSALPLLIFLILGIYNSYMPLIVISSLGLIAVIGRLVSTERWFRD